MKAIKTLKRVEEIEQWGPIDTRLLYNSFWFSSMSGKIKSKWGVYWTEMVGIIKRDTGVFYWNTGDLEQVGKTALKKWMLPPAKRKTIISEYYSLLRRMDAIKIQAQKKGAKFTAIKSLFLEWQDLYYKFWSLTDVFEISNYGSPKYLNGFLKKYIPDGDLHAALETLLAPERLSFNQLGEKKLLLCRARNQTHANFNRALEQYADKWHWLNNSYYGSTKLTAAYFKQKLRKISKTQARKALTKINNYPKTVLIAKRAIAKKYRLPRSVTHLASISSLSVWFQDHRKAFAWQTSETLTFFASKLAQEYNLKLPDVLHFSSEEFVQTFRNGKLPKLTELRKRQLLLVMHMHDRNFDYLTGIKAKKIENYFKRLYLHSKTDTVELKGLVVSKGAGKIRGKARVFFTAKDSRAFRKGEILVAPMTSPDYIHAMRLASAIVTDVGGLTSHAAVVSRELGIPCIVNTKLATKIFKTGDMVVVDAQQGIITKI